MTCRAAERSPEMISGSAQGISTLAQHLPAGHAHAARGVAGCGVDLLDAGVRAGQDRRHREHDEDELGRARGRRRRPGSASPEPHDRDEEQARGSGSRAAAPVRLTARNRPRPVWPTSRPSGTAISAASASAMPE